MFPCSEVLVASANELYDSGAGKMLNNKNNAESVGKLQPRVCFETLGQKWGNRFFATLKELRRVLRLRNRDATPSELRLREMNACPRVAKAQPWAGISERFQRW
jgi:hypothetical protein